MKILLGLFWNNVGLKKDFLKIMRINWKWVINYYILDYKKRNFFIWYGYVKSVFEVEK